MLTYADVCNQLGDLNRLLGKRSARARVVEVVPH
jgi:hypothetical protein